MQKLNITIGPQQNIWFTSDMHFGHRNVIRFCSRPYTDEKHMGQELIKNWNDTVKPNDFIFSLGDFSWWTDRHGVKKLVEQLRGMKYFLPGNHCKEGMYELIDSPTFHECSDTVVLYIRPSDENDPRFGGVKCFEIVLNHYPLLTWSHVDYQNCYQFFGHIHSKAGQPMMEFGELLNIREGKQYDVGCDRHDWKPINLFEAIKLCKEYKHSNY